MRIIAGRWRGRRLPSPTDPGTRPVLDRVKESLFSALGSWYGTPGALPPICVLDLFCGCGSLGLEALSRGAAWCGLVEASREPMRQLLSLVHRLGCEGQTTVVLADAIEEPWPRGPEPAALCFVDPPYSLTSDPAQRRRFVRLLERLARDPALRSDSLIVLRHEKHAGVADLLPEGLQVQRQQTYGRMTLTWLLRAVAGGAEHGTGQQGVGDISPGLRER